MSIQPWVHVETFEEYKERFKDFAILERTEDGILFCQLTWKGGPVMWPGGRKLGQYGIP